MNLGVRLALASLLLAACGDNGAGEDRQGGATTVDDRTQNAYLHPAANLTTDELAVFQAGKGPFDFHWEIPQLGPLFNNDSCFGCHGSNGRGRSVIGDDGDIGINGPVSQSLVRVSQPEGTPADPGGDVPVPGFGLQLQDHATVGLPEVFVKLTWDETTVTYGDGEVASLRQPNLDIRTGNNGYLPAGTLTSYRQAPPLLGLGLLEAIDEETLHALEDPADADHDGISGRLNHVWDPVQQATVIGRFGWRRTCRRCRSRSPARSSTTWA